MAGFYFILFIVVVAGTKNFSAIAVVLYRAEKGKKKRKKKRKMKRVMRFNKMVVHARMLRQSWL
jgi:hypothetical protein